MITDKEFIRDFISSMLAGMCISIGCVVNLMSGGGIPGAILFTFGLIAVIHYKYKLFTGTAGFISSFKDFAVLMVIVLIGNLLGCGLMSWLMSISIDGISEKCFRLLSARSEVDNIQSFIRAVFCGLLMTTSVKFAKEGKWLPLLFAVPVFIIAGFYHCIADFFYMCCASQNHTVVLGYYYPLVILGNMVGCNIHRLCYWKVNESSQQHNKEIKKNKCP